MTRIQHTRDGEGYRRCQNCVNRINSGTVARNALPRERRADSVLAS